MGNNRNASTLVRSPKILFNILTSLFRPRHQFKPLWKYHYESWWSLGSKSPDWCFRSNKGFMDKGRSFYTRKQKSKENGRFLTGIFLFFFFLIQDNVELDKKPMFNKVTYSDSGRYECDVTMGPLSRKASFELVVEGKHMSCWVWLLHLNYLLNTHYCAELRRCSIPVVTFSSPHLAGCRSIFLIQPNFKLLLVIRTLLDHFVFANKLHPWPNHLLIQMYLKSCILLQVLQLSASCPSSAVMTANTKSWVVWLKALLSQLFPGASTAPWYAHSPSISTHHN